MKNVIKEILGTSMYLLVVLCLTYLVITFVGQRTQVIGSSMESTLSNNDNLIVDKISYRFQANLHDVIAQPITANSIIIKGEEKLISLWYEIENFP